MLIGNGVCQKFTIDCLNAFGVSVHGLKVCMRLRKVFHLRT